MQHERTELMYENTLLLSPQQPRRQQRPTKDLQVPGGPPHAVHGWALNSYKTPLTTTLFPFHLTCENRGLDGLIHLKKEAQVSGRARSGIHTLRFHILWS